jgi:hypothetical protein
MRWRVLNIIQKLLQCGRRPRSQPGQPCQSNQSNIAFGSHGKFKLSNSEIENATRRVQTAAELTRYPLNDIAIAALPYVNWFTSGRRVFSCRCVACWARSGRSTKREVRKVPTPAIQKWITLDPEASIRRAVPSRFSAISLGAHRVSMAILQRCRTLNANGLVSSDFPS